jgi:hypothetical protein
MLAFVTTIFVCGKYVYVPFPWRRFGKCMSVTSVLIANAAEPSVKFNSWFGTIAQSFAVLTKERIMVRFENRFCEPMDAFACQSQVATVATVIRMTNTNPYYYSAALTRSQGGPEFLSPPIFRQLPIRAGKLAIAGRPIRWIKFGYLGLDRREFVLRYRTDYRCKCIGN